MSVIDPANNMVKHEQLHLFMCYCTLVMNLAGKKISIQNVFVQTLENDKMRGILKDLLTLDSDFEVVMLFLDFDPSIAKSKYVTRFLNNTKKYGK